MTVIHSTYPLTGGYPVDQFITELQESMAADPNPVMVGDVPLIQLYMNGL